MKKTPIPLPITEYKRTKNKLGPRYVECMITNRYLEFPKSSIGHFGGGEFMDVNVMTFDHNDCPRKICGLVLTREQLLAALSACAGPESQDNK